MEEGWSNRPTSIQYRLKPVYFFDTKFQKKDAHYYTIPTIYVSDLYKKELRL
jgi:hypothetical protein